MSWDFVVWLLAFVVQAALLGMIMYGVCEHTSVQFVQYSLQFQFVLLSVHRLTNVATAAHPVI